MLNWVIPLSNLFSLKIFFDSVANDQPLTIYLNCLLPKPDLMPQSIPLVISSSRKKERFRKGILPGNTKSLWTSENLAKGIW